VEHAGGAQQVCRLTREGEPEWHIERSRRTICGVGIHDVIVETPDHALTTSLLPQERVQAIVECYRQRFRAVSDDPRIAHITIFKNHGVRAGTSLEHLHSQMIGTPVISSHVRQRLYEAVRHFDEFGECIFCGMMQEELAEDKRVALASEHFLAIEPFASVTPFATAIYPRRHMASFGDVRDHELADLARILRTMLAKLYVGLDNPDYNYTIRTAPAEAAGVKYYHIISRLTRVAGFELGLGMFINTVLPEHATTFLRGVDVEQLTTAVG
jgi:UDPglucose--hexose-1-phosphate uridylyltransferase